MTLKVPFIVRNRHFGEYLTKKLRRQTKMWA